MRKTRNVQMLGSGIVNFGRVGAAAALAVAFAVTGCGEVSDGATAGGDVEQVASAVTPTTESQINCGSTMTIGNYVADTGFTGGATLTHADPINTSWVFGGPAATVYQTARVGDFTYTFGGFPPNWPIQFRLYFAETFFTDPGKRVFDVKVGTTTVLPGFDIIKAVRLLKPPLAPGMTGKDIAIEKIVGGNSDANGNIVLAFAKGPNGVNQSLISAISVAPLKQ